MVSLETLLSIEYMASDSLLRKISDIRLLTSALLLPWMLAGCTTLPSNGPTRGQVEASVKRDNSALGIALIDITPETVARLVPEPLNPADAFQTLDRSAESDALDLIRPGDTLSLSIFEVGVSLFSGMAAGGGEDGALPAASAQHLNAQVDEAGGIQLPYVGYMIVAGRTPREVGAMVEEGLRGMSQRPQVLITIADSLTNTAFIYGAVPRPGRHRLSVARERLWDYLAMAGGTPEPEDIIIRLTRNGQVREMRLADIPVHSSDDVILLPGDRVEVLRRPQTYTVFGASEKVAQMPFKDNKLLLSEAIARAGGPADARANPRGVFLFRLEPGEPGQPARPVIYRLDLMNPASYFLAQRIAMHDKDLLYFANSASSPPSKLIGIVNQLFGPFVTARALTR